MPRLESFPLHWPQGQPRTDRKDQLKGKFDTPLGEARDSLYWELERMGATDIVLTSNLELRRDGRPYAKQLLVDEDAGTAVYFTLDGGDRCVAIDKFQTIQANMQALRLSIAAMRGLERWGGAYIVKAAFRGFEALSSGDDDPYSTLHIPRNAQPADVRAAYRSLAKVYHPDAGGDTEHWMRIQTAYDTLTK